MTTGVHDALRGLVAFMRAEKIAQYTDGTTSILLHPSAFAASLAEPTTLPDEEPSCRCGHDLATEHNEAGCLRGCAHDSCVPPDPLTEEP